MRGLAAAIEKGGALKKTTIRDELRKLDLRESLLPGQVLRFGKGGQVDTPFVIVQNKPGGRVDLVYPKDATNGEAVVPPTAQK